MQTPAPPPWSATAIAAAVRTGQMDPRDGVEASLAAIAERNPSVGAFVLVRADAARAEAAALAERPDLADLPLAGVPVAIKDNLDVAGESTRDGTLATDAGPASRDHATVSRLRAAGAIIVGKTTVPELCVWGASESDLGSAVNPWSLDRIAGGSSGGSAAAVAAGMVPVAMGNDGMGSIRIPAAVCGLFGFKPGPGVVPSELGVSSWQGMSENGPLTTTVADARLMLRVLADDDEYAAAALPADPLRIAVSTRPPVAGTRVARSWRRAVEGTAEVLAAAGHTVVEAHPPYQVLDALTLGGRWTAGVAEEVQQLDAQRLQRRTRGHLRFGQVLRGLGFTGDHWRQSWDDRLRSFFTGHDVLITPTLAQPPPRAAAWHRKSWLANVWRDANYAPYPARFNLAPVPAASVPWGLDEAGVPTAVQLVAWRGGEKLLLTLSQQLEQLHPWGHHPPAFPPAAPAAQSAS